jgi:hypothetical protein
MMADSPTIAEVRRPIMQENEQMASQQLATSSEVTDLSGGLLGVIARAARDPAVDIDKMERLLQMQEQVMARQAKGAFAVALAELQPHLPVISERGKILNGKGDVQSTYARWEDINEAIRPLLAEHGFSLNFRTGRADKDVTVTGVLTHREGHSEETTITLPVDSSGSKNAVQAVASSTQYGKRYTASALLNITSRGEDDDGQSATYKDARGNPMPRAKLAGPHTSKTALRTAVNAIIAAVRAAQSAEEINQILRDGKETREQAERDWPMLINGDPEIEEDEGLRGAVARQRAALAEDGMVQVMIQAMKRNTTLASLGNWRDTNDEAIGALDGAEARTFQLAYDMYESTLSAGN